MCYTRSDSVFTWYGALGALHWHLHLFTIHSFETTILQRFCYCCFFISIWIMSCNICWLLPSNLRPDDILRGSLLEMLQLARSPWGVLPILASPLGSHHPEHGIHIPVASSYKNKNKRKKHQQQAEVCQSWSLLCGATTENMKFTYPEHLY